MTQGFAKVFFAVTLLISISSCDRKSCAKVTCPSDQTCVDGGCVCFNGFEGTNCDTLSTIKYTGNWNVSESCEGSPSPFSTYYYLTISPVNGVNGSSIINEIAISAFFGQGSLLAYIINTGPGDLGNTLTIPAQTVGTVSVSASQGTYSDYNNTPEISITLNYYVSSTGQTYTCQETLHKQ